MKSLLSHLRLTGLSTWLFACVMSSSVLAVPAKDTSTSGPWNVGTNWTPAGVPVAGPGGSVNIDLTMTVTAPASFGDSSENSLWSAGTLQINSGQTLTNVSGSTFVKVAGTDLSMQSGGTLINQGILDLQNNLWRINANTVIQNENVFRFSQNGSRLYLQQNGSRLNNMTGGTVNVALPSATNVAIIDGPADVDGNLQNFSASPMVTFTQGILNYGPPNGGTLTDTLFASLFDATSLNSTPSKLRLGGGWDAINLTGATNMTNVTLGASFYTRPSGSSFNVTAPGGGLRWDAGIINIAPGRTLTNFATLTKVATTDLTMQGGGTLANQGTLDLQNNLLRMNANTVIDNSGTFLFSENGSRLYLQQNGARVRNLSGGSIVVNLPSATNVAIIDGPADVDGNLENYSASPMVTFTQGILNYGPNNGGVLTDALFASLFDATSLNANPAQLRLGGGWDAINLTAATDMTKVTLGASFYARPTNSTFSVTAPGGGLRWNAGSINIAAGRTLTNLETMTKVATTDLTVQGGGTFVNEGTFDHQNNLLRFGANTTISNNGLYIFSQAGSRLYFGAANALLLNQADGVIRASAPSGTALIDGAVPGLIDNQGTIEVTSAELDIALSNSIAQLSGSTLTGGTWKVLANGGVARLDMHAADATPITTIGAGATVVLSAVGGGSWQFPQLGVIQDVQGALFSHTNSNVTLSNSVTVSGTLGGDGIFTNAGTITLNGGELDPSSLTGGAGTLTINGNLTLGNTTQLSFSLDNPGIIGGGINDLVTVNGNLTLDGVLDITDLPNFGTGTYRLFNYSGTLFNNGLTLNSPYYILDTATFGQVNLLVLPVPEPSTGWLLLVGLAALRRRKRR